jgi:urease accessory protein
MTKVYRMAYGYASQRVRLRAEVGSYLEYLPDPTIPFRGARYYQEISLERAPGATLVGWDILLPGRVAAAEAFDYDVVYLNTRGEDLEGQCLFQDVMLLEPGRRRPGAIGLLGPYAVVGSLFVLCDATHVHQLVDTLAGMSVERDTLLGATALPNRSGAMARVVSSTTAGAQKALVAAWAAARTLLVGEGLPELRKY